MYDYDSGGLVTDPKQERAKITVDQLLEGAFQVLDRAGERDVTTQKFADRAGFSIGTLYRYFPNKSAVLRALALKEARTYRDKVKNVCDAHFENPDDIIRMTIRIGIRLFDFRLNARRRIAANLQTDTEFLTALQEVMTDCFGCMATSLVKHDPVRFRQLTDMETTMLAGLVLGPIRFALMASHEDLRSPAFEDSLTRTITHFISSGREH